MSSIESIIDRQLRRWELEKNLVEGATEEVEQPFNPVITMSRQRGSRGSYIARKLAERFNYALLHKNLIDQMCKSSGYKRRIIESLDEQSRSRVETWFQGMIEGSYIDATDYARYLHEVIYSIAELGGVVVVGRGANHIIGLQRGFHVRVVAPSEARIENLMKFEKLSRDDAAREIDRSDAERRDFIKKQYNKSADSPLGYDLIINSNWVPVESVINSIAVLAMEKFGKLREQKQPTTS